ncbi:leukocyte-associated immunoglobulin-like receptor 1 [Mesoplodon densirostris]|uniref:leukocyte-associated immunoglobulin-like receptor 1 n=1 Tax=Mesoplodon densirostris TaxID=48708 RepID=UPI0028DC1A86|nr:leukocyte-associated immunoglobulin-like receptor 1 [Mesoplodon densirostris]
MDAEILLLPILGTLPRRSTRAEPDSVSPQGWPVTIVCRGPAGAEEFRLERTENRSDFKDENTVSQIGPHETEARFTITAVSGDTAQHYQCLYRTGSDWSEPRDALEPVVTGEEVSALPSGSPAPSRTPSPLAPSSLCTHISLPSHLAQVPGASSHLDTTVTWALSPSIRVGTELSLLGWRGERFQRRGLPTEHVSILIGVPVAFLLCLLLLGLFLLHRQRKRKRGPPSSEGEEQRPQERRGSWERPPGPQSPAPRAAPRAHVSFLLRLSPAVDAPDGTPDLATVDRLPEKNVEVDTSAPAAGGPQEVIYAQLDHPALTQRVARAVPPLSTEPTAKSSTYAALARN